MSDYTFDAGVRPGGLRSGGDIKILVCYILSLCGDEPLTIDSLAAVVIETAAANFFEAGSALAALCRNKIAVCVGEGESEGYILSEDGAKYLSQVVRELPVSIRNQTAEVFKKQRSARHSQKENIAKIEECEGGYMVTCSVMDHEKELLTIRLLVSGRDEANRMRTRFIENTTVFYKTVIALMTGDISLCQNP